MSEQAAGRHVGVVGLAVMGENLALNIARNGFPVSVYNRTASRTDAFLAERGTAAGVVGFHDIGDFVRSLARPRRIILMVKAGQPVDDVIAELRPFLEPGDIVVDGGNSFFKDTERRGTALADAGLSFVGMGVSGGEEGALWGPSLMPGGPREAYDHLAPMLEAIAAKTEAGPCVTYIGPGGSGHYVKMVHNGIEYGDMQLIAESYDVIQHALGLDAPAISEVFRRWNGGKLASYLIEVTTAVLAEPDPDTGRPLVDLILDVAEQKGTGRWTSESALELGTPVPTIDAAVIARLLSARKALRVAASKVLHGPDATGTPDGLSRDQLIDALEKVGLSTSIQARLQEREAEERRLIAELVTLEDVLVKPKDIPKIGEEQLQEWIASIRAALTGDDVDLARQAIRQFVAKIVVNEKAGTIFYTFPLSHLSRLRNLTLTGLEPVSSP